MQKSNFRLAERNVRSFDEMDDGDPTVPPQFCCEKCGGIMYPEYYNGIHGYEYRITDIR